jgi:hypothetical protein
MVFLFRKIFSIKVPDFSTSEVIGLSPQQKPCLLKENDYLCRSAIVTMSTSMHNFLGTLAATTVSIVLTFGTTAIIDRRKQKAQKREMVMMVMYDMRESLKEMKTCDESIKSFFDTQMDLIAHPQEFHSGFSGKTALLATAIPSLTYSTTTENIFRSNVETIQTIGNILFVETVSSFYDYRSRYKSMVSDPFQEDALVALSSYEDLCDFDASGFPFFSFSQLRLMEECLEQCKLMMKVTDKDLDVFSSQQEKLLEATRGNNEEVIEASYESAERKQRWQEARAAGRRQLQEMK